MACRMRSGITTARPWRPAATLRFWRWRESGWPPPAAWTSAREMPSYHNPAGLSGHIMNIWTDPAFRGRGIAWRMLDLLTAAACERGCLTVSLHTTAMGRPLYQRYGFTATDDEMELELPAEKSEP